jgi:GTF2I-like repeat
MPIRGFKQMLYVSADATGRRRSSYTAKSLSSVAVSGLPAGVRFKTPGSYGVKDLKAIVANGENLQFIGNYK